MEQTEADLRHKLEERLRFETLLAEISARFVHLSADRIDGEIEDAHAASANASGWICLHFGSAPTKNRVS